MLRRLNCKERSIETILYPGLGTGRFPPPVTTLENEWLQDGEAQLKWKRKWCSRDIKVHVLAFNILLRSSKNEPVDIGIFFFHNSPLLPTYLMLRALASDTE